MAVTEYLGAIKIFGGTYAPKAYAFAAGQLLSIQQNVALFSLYGTFYGGNGVSNFALPDLRSRLPLGQGQGLGLSFYSIGEIGGTENVTMLSTNVPPHNHLFNASGNPATTNIASTSTLLGKSPTTTTFYAPAGGSNVRVVQLNPNAVGPQGGNLPHNNIQPSMGLNYIVSLQGVFPSQG
jgi:microcystin-dependent protein